MSILFPIIASAIITVSQPPTGLGFSIAHQRGDEWKNESLAMLNPPVWKDWLYDHAGEPGYIPQVYGMIRWDEKAAQAARLHSGDTWILGSEPELELGTHTHPEDAAEFSRRWDSEVGGSWGAPGIILWDGGYDWLERYLAAGGIVGDHWHVHLYDVSTPDDWSHSWQRWRTWMARNGLERPTIIGETAGWDANVNQADILDRIAETMADDPLLETVLFYSDKDYWGLWQWADLRTDTGLTPLGQHYLAMQAAAVPTALPVDPEPKRESHRVYLPLGVR